MPKESGKSGISQALLESHQKRAEADKQEINAQKEYERGVRAVHGKIGAFIDDLRQDPRYVQRETASKKFVTIDTGFPTEWDGLPEDAANFLGIQQDPKILEYLTIDAYEKKRVRLMQFRIRDIEGRTLRLIRVSAASTWHGSALDMECIPDSSLTDAPEPIVEAYHRIVNIYEGKNRKAEMLVMAESLVGFGEREAVKAIRAR